MSSGYDSLPVMGKQYKPASKPCNICEGQITWEFRPDGRPGHIDASGYSIGDGKCPGPKKKPAPDGKYIATAKPPTPGNFIKLFENARVHAIKAVGMMHEAILIADHIIGDVAAVNSLSTDKAAEWNNLNNSQRAAYLAGLLEQVGFPTEQPMHAAALLRRATEESKRWFSGDGALDVLLNWCEIAGIDLGFEVRT